MKALTTLSLGLIVFVAVMTGCSATSSSFGKSAASQSLPLTSSVRLNWTATAGSPTPSGYLIAQSTDNVHFTQVQTVPTPTASTATISGLPVGKTYYFEVAAYNPGGSNYTASISILVPSPSPSPSASP
jgi:hypothetical protein